MTLDTRVYVLDPIDVREVFAHCQQLLRCPPDTKVSDSGTCLENVIGQGFDAWLQVCYSPDGPHVSEAQAAHTTCNDWCEPDEDYHYRLNANFLEVSFDTAYGYAGPEGGCAELHVRLISELGQWLDERGIRWRWKNEFTGDVYDGFDGLETLLSGGGKATEWFRGTVIPALRSGTLFENLPRQR